MFTSSLKKARWSYMILAAAASIIIAILATMLLTHSVTFKDNSVSQDEQAESTIRFSN
jgi:putative flippase GtrA